MWWPWGKIKITMCAWWVTQRVWKVHVPENSFLHFYRTMLHLDEAPLLDHAHRSLRQRPNEGAPPRPIILRVHYLPIRDQIPRRAGEASPLLLHGKRLSIFPDFSPSVAKKRLEFVDAKRRLHTWPGVKFSLYYPAELRITLPGGALAIDFINRDLRKSASPDPEWGDQIHSLQRTYYFTVMVK